MNWLFYQNVPGLVISSNAPLYLHEYIFTHFNITIPSFLYLQFTSYNFPILCVLKSFYSFIYFWLCWVFIAVLGVSLSCGEQVLLFRVMCGLFTLVASLGAQSLGLQQLQHRSSVIVVLGLAPQHVKTSWPRDWIHAPCIDRQFPIHCTTREVPRLYF